MPVTLKGIWEHDLGITWTVDEPLARSAHAIVDDGRVWLIDPIHHLDALERAAALGEPAGVLQLLDRHGRDCEAVARQLGVPRLRVPDVVAGSPFEAIPALRAPGWKETALWWPGRQALVVAEVVGTAVHYTGGRREVGMHLFLRPLAPKALRGRRPEHLLVGHGEPVHGQAAADGLEDAYARARRDIPQVLRALPGSFR